MSLTTHVLDTSRGRPAVGVRVDFSEVAGDGTLRPIASVVTDGDGRARVVEELHAGCFELTFYVGEWFGGAAAFYDRVPVRFNVAEPGRHHHVPLLVSPFGYVTYRGS